MKTKNLYWKRLISETPKALKKLRLIAGSIAAMCTAMAVPLATFEKTQKVAIVLGIIGGVMTGVAAGCSFATTDPDLQNNIPS